MSPKYELIVFLLNMVQIKIKFDKKLSDTIIVEHLTDTCCMHDEQYDHITIILSCHYNQNIMPIRDCSTLTSNQAQIEL